MNRMVKKLIGWILCAVMAVGMLPVAAREAKAADTDAGAGEGIVWNDEKDYYEISSYAGLLEFAKIVNGTPAHFPNDSAANAKIVVEKIDASASNPSSSGYNAQTTAWTPIGSKSSPYTGTFDGNGCKITNLTIDLQEMYIGLFGYVWIDGRVTNVTLEGGSIKGSSCVGGVVGNNEGIVSDCCNTGAVSGSTIVGGVVGRNIGGEVLYCNNTGAVSGSSCYVGGVLGSNGNGGTVTNSYNDGIVNGGRDAGGVAGWNDGTVLNCHNTGAVSGSGGYVGGVLGSNNDSGEVSNCYNTGKVSSESSESSAVGGVVGYNKSNCEVSNCYNTGKVSSEYGSVGGVVGYNLGLLLNCYNVGDVEGSSAVGGVVGDNSGEVSNCYNTGKVSSEKGGTVGGVAGTNNTNGKISNCYNIGEVSGPSWSAVGGVVGYNGGTVSNCFYNISIKMMVAIGSNKGDKVVDELTTLQMTGENAKTSMKDLLDAKDGKGNPVWIVRENSLGTYYYPHLKGFAYDATGDVKDWPATISSGYTYELDSASFDYNGEIQKPKVTVKENGDEVEGAPYSFTFVESVNAGEYIIEFENTETHVKGVIPYSIKKRGLEIIAYNQTFTYNGQMQGPGDTTYEEKKKIEELIIIGGAGLADTHSISNITLDGQGDEAKTYEKELIPYNAVIVNTDGDVVTTNYEIEYIPGDLIISPIPVTLTADSGTTVTYDGTEKTVSGYTCSVEGLTFDGVTAGVSATKAGTYEVTFAGVTLEKTTDTTGNYTVTKTENSTLTINKKPLTITADSASAECDGTALAKNSYTISELAKGDSVENVTITGSQTGPGSCDNVPSAAKIVNADGEDVTDCYDITYVNGKLTVAEHSFELEVVDAKYQKSAADCTHAAVYFKSCKCGEKGTETFTSGDPLGHKWKAATGYAPKTCEICGATEGDVIKYTSEGGNTIEFTQGDQKNIIKIYHRSEDDEHAIDHHKGVQIDGKDVKVDAKSGSVILTFDAATLNALDVGDHVIKVIFDDWVDELKLVIKAPVAPIADATPTTGDSSLPVLWATLLLLSMAGASVVVMRRRKQA